MDNSASSNTTQNMSIAGAMLAYRLQIEMVTSICEYLIFVRFIQKARRKSITIEDKEVERPNVRQLLLDKNKQLMLEKQMRQNIKQGHKSKNWDLIKQKITTAKVK